ncbi:MAG: hypothetical protein V1916_00695 [Patescibacteria group bacterium]
MKVPSGILERWSKPDCLFWFAALWAVVQISLILLEYAKVKISVPYEMPIFYAVLVLLYVLRKQADSWLDTTIKKRKGEYFLIGWWFALLVMFVIQVVTGGRYAVPRRMVETCLLISIPFVVGEFLKAHQALILKRTEPRTNGQTRHSVLVRK